MSIGIDQIATVAKPTDIIICFNNDITFPDEIVEEIIEKITNDNHLVISPLSVSPHDGRVIATGVKVKNWYLGINETPFKEQKFDKISASDLIEVDYLTQRFMAFQARLIFEAGNYNCKWLPHYGGDYEFTFRAKKSGYNVVIDPAKKVHIDETATGLNSKYRKLTLSQRLINRPPSCNVNPLILMILFNSIFSFLVPSKIKGIVNSLSNAKLRFSFDKPNILD